LLLPGLRGPNKTALGDLRSAASGGVRDPRRTVLLGPLRQSISWELLKKTEILPERVDSFSHTKTLEYNKSGSLRLFPGPRLFLKRVVSLTDKSSAAVADPAETTAVKPREKPRQKPKRQPRYNVILWDDNDHTYEYVVRMMKELFGHSNEKGFQIARMVDTAGRAVCLTTTREHAELKRDQIHAYGKDPLIDRCEGSMSATIEPVPGDDQ